MGWPKGRSFALPPNRRRPELVIAPRSRSGFPCRPSTYTTARCGTGNQYGGDSLVGRIKGLPTRLRGYVGPFKRELMQQFAEVHPYFT
jgi:hypothetical protein